MRISIPKLHEHQNYLNKKIKNSFKILVSPYSTAIVVVEQMGMFFFLYNHSGIILDWNLSDS